MDIETRMVRTAFHEVYHALYYTQGGLHVKYVEIHPKRETRVVWPYEPKMLWEAYAQHPLRALSQFRIIVGMLLAPEILLKARTVGDDLEILEKWETSWTFARGFSNPEGPTFDEVRVQAAEAVRTWYASDHRSIQVRYLAGELLERNHVDWQAWKSLVDRAEEVAAPGWRKRRYASV